MDESIACERWHRLCEALYREHRHSNPPRMDWREFAKKHPDLNVPPTLKDATQLQSKTLRNVLERLAMQACWARIAAVDLGILSLIDPTRLKKLPASIYGDAPDPFEGNGICDNPPEV